MMGVPQHLYQSVRQNRWWIYQRSRFPIVKYGLLIAIFSGSAVWYSALLHGRSPLFPWTSWSVAFISVFCFFLQIRIADEFKDAEEDRRYRPDRPVPSGLVTLPELAAIGLSTALLQLGLALYFLPKLVLLLGLVWGYFLLMSGEFFVKQWLKSHLVIYTLSHMVIVALIALYAIACEAWVAGETFSLQWVPFLAMCYCNGLVIEIGRKIRAPESEQEGVPTYSILWGYRSATFVWLGCLGLTALSAVLSAHQIQSAMMIAPILGGCYLVAVMIARRFLKCPSPLLAERIDQLSGIWTLILYFSAGLLPMMMRLLIKGN